MDKSLMMHAASITTKSPLISRHRVNVVAIGQSLLFPWLLFCLVNADITFGIEYLYAWLSGGFVLLAGAFVLCLAMQTVAAYRRDPAQTQPTWYGFIFITSLAALGMALVLGTVNHRSYVGVFHDLSRMNSYKSVNPSTVHGEQLMDAGSINFVEEVEVDTQLSIGYKLVDTFCVAPITVSGAALSTYDFWAVGINCCSPNPVTNLTDFTCTSMTSQNAHGGLRLLRDEVRPTFMKAVTKAQTAYGIAAEYPLFFFWVDDPQEALQTYMVEAWRYFYVGMLVHFGFQLLCVALALKAFAVRKPPLSYP